MERKIPQIQQISIPHHDVHLAGRLHLLDSTTRALAIISHGLFSSKDSQKLTRLADALASDGYLTLIFDHMGCGASPGDIFDTSLTSRRQEFMSAVHFLKGREPDTPLIYLGSSFGGTVALLATEFEMPLCSVHWSTPWDYTALRQGIEDGQRPPMPALVRDLPSHDLDALLARSAGMFLVHGELDEVVPQEQAIRAHELTNEPKGILMLPGGDHRLSAPEDQRQAIDQSLKWIARFLS